MRSRRRRWSASTRARVRCRLAPTRLIPLRATPSRLASLALHAALPLKASASSIRHLGARPAPAGGRGAHGPSCDGTPCHCPRRTTPTCITHLPSAGYHRYRPCCLHDALPATFLLVAHRHRAVPHAGHAAWSCAPEQTHPHHRVHPMSLTSSRLRCKWRSPTARLRSSLLVATCKRCV